VCGAFFADGFLSNVLFLCYSMAQQTGEVFPFFFDVEPLIRLVAPIPELLFLKDGSKHSEGSWFERRRFAPRPLQKKRLKTNKGLVGSANEKGSGPIRNIPKTTGIFFLAGTT